MNPVLKPSVSSAFPAAAAAHEPDMAAEPIGLDVMQAYRKIVARQVILIDVRPDLEFARLRIPEARNVPMKLLHQPLRIPGSSPAGCDTPICVYAATGAASRRAAAEFLRLGCRDVAYLSAGFVGWQRKGLPCVTEIDGELIRIVTERVGLPSRVFVFD